MSAGTLTVLGCDGSFAGPGGAASGYLVQGASTTVWLDAGPGTFARLQEVCSPGTIDAVVLTHEHPDHWTDVESFAVWARMQRRTEPFLVLAPPGLRERSYFGGDRSLRWVELQSSLEVEVKDLRCRFSATDHGPPTLAVAFERVGSRPGEAILAYSADTGPDWTPAELGDPIGTLLCEATYTEAYEGRFKHLSGRQAGALAREAGVAELVVTHRWPTIGAEDLVSEAERAFGRPVRQAAPGMVLGW